MLFVASELAPLVKTGGLGDVAAALPVALRDLKVDARVLIPGYPQVLGALESQPVTDFLNVLPDMPAVQLRQATMPVTRVPVYVLHCPALYDRDGGPYQRADGRDWPDNSLRFGVLCRMAAWLGTHASPLGWRPDVVHCNDWQTGLTPAYLHFAPDRSARTVQSIHNMAFLGLYGPELLEPLSLPAQGFHPDGFEFHGGLSFLKAGLSYADQLTTVSPSYAQEIQQPAFGFGLDGLLRHRQSALQGILNGIDAEEWNPATDPHLAKNYSVATLRDKHHNKRALRKRLGLESAPKTPLLGMVCRLSPQKGVDLVVGALQRLASRSFQVAILGSGAANLTAELRSLANAAPGRIAFVSEFDESLAHLIEAGADIFLMPSRFEPCGLNQMYSMRYGTVPVVRRTGGLADTVVDTTPAHLENGTATGFVFDHADVDGMTWALSRTLDCYDKRRIWKSLQRAGMERDWSWARSARAYVNLYKQTAALP